MLGGVLVPAAGACCLLLVPGLVHPVCGVLLPPSSVTRFREALFALRSKPYLYPAVHRAPTVHCVHRRRRTTADHRHTARARSARLTRTRCRWVVPVYQWHCSAGEEEA